MHRSAGRRHGHGEYREAVMARGEALQKARHDGDPDCGDRSRRSTTVPSRCQRFSDRPTDICVRSTVSAWPLPGCGQVLVDGLGGDRGVGRVEPPFDAMEDVEELADLRAGEGVEHQPS